MELPKREGRVVETKTVRFVEQCQLSLFEATTASFSSRLGRRYSLIACSNKFGYVFALHPISKELGIFQSKKIDASAASKSTRTATILNNESLEAKRLPLASFFTEPTHVFLSDDELTLIVCGSEANSNLASVCLFSVVDIVSGNGTAPFGHGQLSSDPNAALVSVTVRPMADAAPAPGSEQQHGEVPSALAIFSDGSLCHFAIQTTPTILGILPQSVGISAVSWSRKGKQFVVGDKTGRLVRFEPSGMKAKATIPSPMPSLCVCDLLWLDNYNYVAAYLTTDGSNTQPQVVFVNTRAEQPVFTDFGDICYGTDDDMSHSRQYFFWHIHEWRLVLALSQTALEGSLLSYNQPEQSWEQLIVEDENCRLTFPADPTSPSYPVGMALSLSSQHPVIIPANLSDDPQASQTTKIPPSPILLVSTTTGAVLAFSVVNSAKDAANLTKDPLHLPGGVQFSQPVPAPVSKPAAPVVATPSAFAPPPTVQSTVLQQQQQILQKQQQQQPVKNQATPQPVMPLFVKASSPIAGQAQQQPQQKPPVTSVPAVSPQPAQIKAQIEQELDNFVAAKIGEEIAEINELYAVWCKSVKPLLEKEAVFTAQMESDRKHFARLLAEINSQLDEYRAYLADLESGFKLLSARLVDGLARAEENRVAITGVPTSPIKPAGGSHHLALSPRHISTIATPISPNLRDRLKQTGVTVTQQLFAACGQQLTRLREMKETLDLVYEALVAKSCEVKHDSTPGSVKNIYEAAHGLQKAVHLQKMFVSELEKKLAKLKQQVAIGQEDVSANRPVVTTAVVKSFSRSCQVQQKPPSVAPSKLSRYLMTNHRMNVITVAPQPSFTEIGKVLPKPPVVKKAPEIKSQQGISMTLPPPPVVTIAHVAGDQKPRVVENQRQQVPPAQTQPENLSTHPVKPAPANLFTAMPSTGFTGFVGGGISQGQPVVVPAGKVEQKHHEKEQPPQQPVVVNKEVPKPAPVPPVVSPFVATPQSSLPAILFKAPSPAAVTTGAPAVTKPTVTFATTTTTQNPAPAPVQISTSSATVIETKPAFGLFTQPPATTSATGVALEVKPVATTVTEPAKPGFGFVAQPSTSNVPTTTTTVTESKPASGFGFAAQPNVSVTSPTIAKPAPQPAETKEKAPQSALMAFLSDQNEPPAPTVPGVPSAPKPAFGAFQQVPATTSAPSSVFGFASVPQPGVVTTAPPSTTSAAPSSVFSFATPTTSAPATTAPSLFSFAPPTTATAPATNLFAATTTAPTPVNVNLFGQPAAVSQPPTTSSTFSFAPPAPMTTSAPSSSAFGFATPSTSVPSTGGGGGSNLFSFVPPAATTAASSAPSMFGQPAVVTTTAAPTTSEPFSALFASSLSDIGKSGSEKPAGSGPFGGSMFGSAPAPASGSVFGGQQSSTGFSFSPKPGGPFGSQQPAAPATGTAFSFGGGAAFGQPASPSANFGGTPAFGGSPSFGGAPVFGGTPGIGSSTPGAVGFGGFGGGQPGPSVFGGNSGAQSGFAALASTGTGAFGGAGSPSAVTPSFTQYRG